MENAGDGMAVDGMLDEEEVVDEVKAGKKLCDELVVDKVRVDIVPVDEVADDVRVAAIDEVRDDVTPIDEVKNDVVPVKEVVDDVQVVVVLGGVVAVDKGVDVAVVVDVVLGNDVVVDVVLDDEIVVDVVLGDGIGVDVVLDDEVVVEVDEMVTNGVAVDGLDVGFDVVAVTPRKKKKKCSIDLTKISLYVLLIHVWNFLAYINSKFSVSPLSHVYLLPCPTTVVSTNNELGHKKSSSPTFQNIIVT